MPSATLQRTARTWHAVLAALATAVTAGLVVTATSAPSYAANPVTPGNYTGLGFDQCEAPSQYAMDRWIKYSPYQAAGIYISGNSRACKRQSNLSPTWVSKQLAAGWHLMPITLGPQASCSTRFPRYGKRIDPTISPSSTNTYAAARSQGTTEANRAADAAGALGIVRGSTLFYDLEAFNIKHSTACTSSALWFLHAWTRQLHDRGYASGYYSSAASGMKIVDDARVRSGNPYTLPDQIWIADWNGKANTSSSYIRADGWQPYARAKQFRGGHNETHGGVTINIDTNYLKLRTPKIGGGSADPAPAPQPGDTGSGGSTGSMPAKSTSMSDPKCYPGSISKSAYRYTSAKVRPHLVVPLQCLLKQQGLYDYVVTGTWNAPTTDGLNAFQRKAGHRVRAAAGRPDFMSLLSTGNSGRRLRRGASSADVVRVQRALNAAMAPHLSVTGKFTRATKRAVRAYQAKVHLRHSGVVTRATWRSLEAGRRR